MGGGRSIGRPRRPWGRHSEMRVEEFGNAKSFLASVESFLVDHEAENCLMLGIANSRVARPINHETFLLAVESDDGAVVGAAIRTVPHDLILSYGMSREVLNAVNALGFRPT